MGRSLEVSPENRGGLYVAIPVYFVVLGIVAFFSYRRARSLEKKQANDQCELDDVIMVLCNMFLSCVMLGLMYNTHPSLI